MSKSTIAHSYFLLATKPTNLVSFESSLFSRSGTMSWRRWLRPMQTSASLNMTVLTAGEWTGEGDTTQLSLSQ